MIMINLNARITDLADGYETIGDFMALLESTWLPGFERSYRRRQSEYARALQKHEERGLFLRTLLKKPKLPQRPPARYQLDTAVRLQKAWKAAVSDERPSPATPLFNLLSETLDDDFLALQHMQLLPNMLAEVIVLGPRGVYLFAATGDPRSPAAPISSPTTLKRVWQQTAVESTDLLAGVERPDAAVAMPVNGGILLAEQGESAQTGPETSAAVLAGGVEFWRDWLRGNDLPPVLDQAAVYASADSLLERHQEISETRTYSALTKAEALTKEEKDNLLRLAATL